jgi:hypothetical protein
MVTPDVLDSVLNSPLPSSAPLTERAQIPFVVAVAHEFPHPQPQSTPGNDVVGQDFRGCFRVAVESLLRDFYSIVALDIIDLPRLTGRMRHEKDIWCNLNKYSEQVRYYD